jgi:CBS domain-containing protein
MTSEVVFAAPGETVAILMGRMTDRRIRHLPVLRDGRLAGVISIGDVVKCQIAEATQEAESLRTYIAAG